MDPVLIRSLISTPGVMAVILLAWGVMVKHAPWLKTVPNRAIPILNFILGCIGYSFAPIDAHAGVGSSVVSHFLSFLSNPVVASALTTALTTGAHSWAKNTKQLLRDMAVAKLAQLSSTPPTPAPKK